MSRRTLSKSCQFENKLHVLSILEQVFFKWGASEGTADSRALLLIGCKRPECRSLGLMEFTAQLTGVHTRNGSVTNNDPNKAKTRNRFGCVISHYNRQNNRKRYGLYSIARNNGIAKSLRAKREHIPFCHMRYPTVA